MDARFKKELLRQARQLIPLRLQGFTAYAATKAQLENFRSGSMVFRNALRNGAAIFVLLSPGPGQEQSFTVHIGWSYSGEITAFDYWLQRRELGAVLPHKRFETGFEQLGVLEEKSAVWSEEIEVLPEFSTVPTEAQQRHVEASVTKALQDVPGRVLVILSRIEQKLGLR